MEDTMIIRWLVSTKSCPPGRQGRNVVATITCTTKFSSLSYIPVIGLHPTLRYQRNHIPSQHQSGFSIFLEVVLSVTISCLATNTLFVHYRIVPLMLQYRLTVSRHTTLAIYPAFPIISRLMYRLQYKLCRNSLPQFRWDAT